MLFRSMDSAELNSGISLYDLIKRPELDYDNLAILDQGRTRLMENVAKQCEIQIKYEGYIDKQLKQIDQFKKLENKKLSPEINYSHIKGLRIEARQKLTHVKPLSVGQASRISGVSPADINVLLIYLEQQRRKKGDGNEL